MVYYKAIKTDKEVSRIKREGGFLRLPEGVVFVEKVPGSGERKVAIRVKKSCGNAFVRNKIRRRIKEAIKKALPKDPSIDINLLIIWTGKEKGFFETEKDLKGIF